jgi:hypothetical protein
MPAVRILGIIFLLLGILSIFFNKRGAVSYAEFQKGWGLEGPRAILVGRLIGIFGGAMFVALGLFLILK